ncbi:unnamed protein product [Ixodes pacificus]
MEPIHIRLIFFPWNFLFSLLSHIHSEKTKYTRFFFIFSTKIKWLVEAYISAYFSKDSLFLFPEWLGSCTNCTNFSQVTETKEIEVSFRNIKAKHDVVEVTMAHS